MKDKEWLKDSLAKEMYNAEIQGIFSSSGMSNLLYDDIVKLIGQLDEPEIADPTLSKMETVEVPQTIGAYIKKERGKNTLGNIADEIYNSEESWSNLSEEYKWMRLNFTLFARAWLNGYAIIPPKTLQVIVKNYDSTVFTTELQEDEAMKLIEGWKEDE